MDKNIIPDIWIQKIKEVFHDGVPNGWLLQWDSDRYSNELKDLALDLEFSNGTSFDYAFCNTYYLYHPSQETENYEMATIDISFVVNAYQVFWTQYSNHGKTGKVISSPSSEKSQIIEKKIRLFLEKNGFTECLVEWSEIKIKGIKLELSDEEATLGKCLFIDYED